MKGIWEENGSWILFSYYIYIVEPLGKIDTHPKKNLGNWWQWNWMPIIGILGWGGGRWIDFFF